MKIPGIYDRRSFLQVVLTGLAAGTALSSCQKDKDNGKGLPTRPLGKTGEDVSILCLGGWDVAAAESERESIRLMHEALDEGIFFWDNCWEYHDGRSEELMGQAMKQNKSRENVFLMTKVCARDYEGAKRYLEDSLRRFQTDMIDLWQFHSIQWDRDPEVILDREKGGIRAALEAQQAGHIRYIGFTGHKDPKYHLAMLNAGFEFDAVQMPINVVDPHYQSFIDQVVPVCNERNIGALGMKSLAAQDARIPRETGIDPALCRRFALSMPVSSLVIGIQNRKELRSDIALARSFQPLSEEEVVDLLAKTESKARDGAIEPYKAAEWGKCTWLREHT